MRLYSTGNFPYRSLEALSDLADEIENGPTIIEAFPDDDAVEPPREALLIEPGDTEALLSVGPPSSFAAASNCFFARFALA